MKEFHFRKRKSRKYGVLKDSFHNKEPIPSHPILFPRLMIIKLGLKNMPLPFYPRKIKLVIFKFKKKKFLKEFKNFVK